MKFSQAGKQITLEMTHEDFNMLLMILGFAAGALHDDQSQFWRIIAFTNRLNTGNPNYTPYTIPEEYLNARP